MKLKTRPQHIFFSSRNDTFCGLERDKLDKSVSDIKHNHWCSMCVLLLEERYNSQLNLTITATDVAPLKGKSDG